MTLATEVKKLTESKPFYALTGVGDYAVEKLREIPVRVNQLQQVRREEAYAYAGRVQGKAENVANTVAERLNTIYDDLAKRGRQVVSQATGEAALELTEVSEAAEPATAAKATTPVKRPAARRSTSSNSTKA
ncbi:hypothetical protein [Herbidospora cretacea]|uniref:hypothetical protein n=1 Tax=Herbidospora cretacea TaxID=28444 RepID=UPI0007733629|nr:hypothetical protein [Herbidospora cretacea]